MKKVILIILLFDVLFCYSQETEYQIKNLNINTEYSDFGISFYGKNKAVYASSRKDLNNYRSLWYDGQPYLELYEGVINSSTGEVDKVVLFSGDLSSKYHESNVCFTKNLKTVYFTRNNYYKKRFKLSKGGENLIQLYKAKVGDNGEWKDIEPMPFNSNNYQTGHPVLNEAEDKLYFTSDMPGGYGLTDIYVVSIDKDGLYGTPKNLGPDVNTEGKEMFPTLRDKEFYYSSDGKTENYGGLDIYKTELSDAGFPIKKAVNVGEPLNSTKDDFSIIFTSKENKGYFSSNRLGGKGSDDIYYFYKKEIEVKEEIKPEPKPKPCNQYIVGTARNGETKRVLSGVSVSLRNSLGVVIESQVTDDTGKYEFKAKCSTGYGLLGSKINYESDKLSFTTPNKNNYKQGTELLLYPNRFVNVRGKWMIDINPIYFDLDQSYIRPDAAIELEKVLKAMEAYPKLKITLGAHTDSRGRDLYNLKLSERRAKSSKRWLVSKGISASRIIEKGYGETELLNRCSNGVKCTKPEHQLNRRVEFIVNNPEILKSRE